MFARSAEAEALSRARRDTSKVLEAPELRKDPEPAKVARVAPVAQGAPSLHCRVCGKDKPATSFALHAGLPSGHMSQCRTCQTKARKARKRAREASEL